METDQILDLFNLGESADSVEKGVGADLNINSSTSGGKDGRDGGGGGGKEEDMVDVTGEVREKGKKGWLDGIGELWDEGQYEEEYNLDGFLGRMGI